MESCWRTFKFVASKSAVGAVPHMKGLVKKSCQLLRSFSGVEGSSRPDQRQVVLLVALAAAWSSALIAWRALGEPASGAWSATSSVVLMLLRRGLARQIAPGDVEQFVGPWPTLDGAWGLGRASAEEVRLFFAPVNSHDS